MPLPEPETAESEDEFIDRCMGDDDAVEEFPEEDQRRAVCQRLWEGRELAEKRQLQSYDDYPQSASNNAQRAIDYKEENGSECGTRVGWTRARQLVNRTPLTRETIARVASFLARSEVYYEPGGSLEKCGNIMYLAWGGLSMKRWADAKLEQIDGAD